jgi:hypothetical protein
MLALSLLALSACHSAKQTSTVSQTPSPTTVVVSTPSPTVAGNFPFPGQIVVGDPANPQPDDVAVIAGGMTYRANIVSSLNPWPTSVPSTGVTLGTGADAATIAYRDFIETQAGQMRNNIINVDKRGKSISQLKLEAIDLPEGITAQESQTGFVAEYQQVISFMISSDIKPGQ